MKEIRLNISNKLVAVTGNDNGQKICREQIINSFSEEDLPIVIIFPEYITTIGSSYIEGIDEVMLEKISIDQLKRFVAIDAKDETARRRIL